MHKVWFITGIGRGLGRELAEQLLAAGHFVFGTARDPSDLRGLIAKYSDALAIEPLDLADDAPRFAAVVEAAAKRFGGIDVLVNNAGYGLFGAAEGIEEGQLRRQLEVNLIAPMLLTKYALPHMRARGKGTIIAISSYGGQATHPGASAYHASKWGVEGYFESLSKEIGYFGLRVLIVEPGAARTSFRGAAAEHLSNTPPGYDQTPIASLGSVLRDPARNPIGDPTKMAAAIIEATDNSTDALRLVLGSDAYTNITTALSQRLNQVEDQRLSAAWTDFT
ncbi:short-subunit dehydrogenase [Rhizobium sp. ERR 922]|uniref:SDR family oxidoreductase n=1 Tax=unclassified Rhizobium TaxID=2613769 RepID=UPI0011A58E7B|nr:MULTISPECIES: SDR family oxidoreductase [unclassified Rhizobium]TWB46368.1 short-subunit dehydrogenase [Rhizobium sp. ERR 922]TWB88735.1 short-subunit dehydrogenase [Rhizobium sp. ERR 942]